MHADSQLGTKSMAANRREPFIVAYQDLVPKLNQSWQRVSVVSRTVDTLVAQELQLKKIGEYPGQATVKLHYIQKQKTPNLTLKGTKR